MKDFSLFYGPARGWLPVIAIAAVALVVFLTNGSSSEPPCVGRSDCPTAVPGELLVDDGSGVVVPTVSDAGADGGVGEDGVDWDRTGRTGSDVPFVSLQPSPDGMTEAGEDLLRSLDDGDAAP